MLVNFLGLGKDDLTKLQSCSRLNVQFGMDIIMLHLTFVVGIKSFNKLGFDPVMCHTRL